MNVFIDLDMTNSFHQIPIDDFSSNLLSVSTPWGLFRPKFLPIDNGCNVKPYSIVTLASRMDDVKNCRGVSFLFFTNRKRVKHVDYPY